MASEPPDEQLERLQAMAAPDQQTWDLSDNDVAAIRWAVDEIGRLRAALDGPESGSGEPMRYELASKHEAWGRYRIGIKVEVAIPHELSDEEKSEVNRATWTLSRLLWRGAEKADRDVTAAIAEEKRELLALFPPGCGHKEIPNGYDESSNFPWLIVYTTRGPITVGRRKRVISIDWADTCIDGTAEDLFPGEDVTRSGKLIHAWGYEKAREYIGALLRRDDRAGG